MNTRGLRAQLDHLIKSMPKPFVDDSGIVVYPTLAKALRDDEVRLEELRCKRRDDVAESEEELMLRARIVDQARTVGRTLGAVETLTCKADRRLGELQSKRRSGALSAAEDAEEAQLAAREAAYREDPRTKAWDRIFELYNLSRSRELTAAEKAEDEALQRRFPCPPSLPADDPYRDICDKIWAAEAAAKADGLDQDDQNLSEEERVMEDTRASHAADQATMNALTFFWRFGGDAVELLLSMRENIGETLERMQQEIDDPGFLERKIGCVLQKRPDGSFATITRLRGRKKQDG